MLNTRRNGNDFCALAVTARVLLICDLKVANQNCSCFGEIVIVRLCKESIDFPHVFYHTLLEFLNI